MQGQTGRPKQMVGYHKKEANKCQGISITNVNVYITSLCQKCPRNVNLRINKNKLIKLKWRLEQLDLKGNTGILKPGPYFSIFWDLHRCQKKSFLKSVQYWTRSIQPVAALKSVH